MIISYASSDVVSVRTCFCVLWCVFFLVCFLVCPEECVASLIGLSQWFECLVLLFIFGFLFPFVWCLFLVFAVSVSCIGEWSCVYVCLCVVLP